MGVLQCSALKTAHAHWRWQRVAVVWVHLVKCQKQRVRTSILARDSLFDGFSCLNCGSAHDLTLAFRACKTRARWVCGLSRRVVEGGGWVGKGGRNSMKSQGGGRAASRFWPWVVPVRAVWRAPVWGHHMGLGACCDHCQRRDDRLRGRIFDIFLNIKIKPQFNAIEGRGKSVTRVVTLAL